jgi:hypothetical protein
MTREQNQLIKKIRNLSPEDVARVLQFLQQLKSPELRVVPMELKAVAGGSDQFEAAQPVDESVRLDAGELDTGTAQAVPPVTVPARKPAVSVAAEELIRAACEAVSPEAEVARAACAQWRRRPFQAIDADDLQPIAELFREAVDIRAASRFRYGSR